MSVMSKGLSELEREAAEATTHLELGLLKPSLRSPKYRGRGGRTASEEDAGQQWGKRRENREHAVKGLQDRTARSHFSRGAAADRSTLRGRKSSASAQTDSIFKTRQQSGCAANPWKPITPPVEKQRPPWQRGPTQERQLWDAFFFSTIQQDSQINRQDAFWVHAWAFVSACTSHGEALLCFAKLMDLLECLQWAGKTAVENKNYLNSGCTAIIGANRVHSPLKINTFLNKEFTIKTATER